MPTMKFTKPRATLEETLQFCNAVREAGGGNPLDALMPATPSDVTQCLIAKNLNFNCGVSTTEFRGKLRWVMVTDSETRDRIAERLGLAKINITDSFPDDWGQERDESDPYAHQELHGVVLPLEIGQVAGDFDETMQMLQGFEFNHGGITDVIREQINTLAPYIEASEREAISNGIINDAGELVL